MSESLLNDFKCTICRLSQGRIVDAMGSHCLVKCVHCQLVHLLPRPCGGHDSYQLDSLEHYESGMRGLAAGFDYHHEKLLRLLFHYAPSPARLLEIGCATGRFLLNARKAGYDITGIEPAQGIVCHIAEEIRSKVINQSLEGTDLPVGAYDVIVAIQLIEHLQDPVVLLERMKQGLKLGGVAYIETPNYDCVSRRLKIQSWRRMNIGPGHWCYFNRKSLKALCEKNGFRVIWTQTFFKALSWHSHGNLSRFFVFIANFILGSMGLGNNVAVLLKKDSES